MNIFVKRKYRKIVKHMLHESRHAKHMREDVAKQAHLDGLAEAQEKVKEAWKTKDKKEVDASLEALSTAIGKVYPAPNSPRARELVEIIAVALIVAWALRTYFIQPFKIPTGSMQPTLYGIVVKDPLNETEKGYKWLTSYPGKILRYLVYGERDVRVKAKTDGQVVNINEDDLGRKWVQIEKVMHKIPSAKLPHFVEVGDIVSKGDLISEGRVMAGDHIFVDKIRYNFARPKLGDIFVFSTQGLDHPHIKTNQFYIKRLSGLPGNKVSIKPPYLFIDDEKVEDPKPFLRVAESKEEGYEGYFLAGQARYAMLRTPDEFIQLKNDEYLPLGDNSGHSLDGKYFGPVKENRIIGPAFAVYWPFSPRWGKSK